MTGARLDEEALRRLIQRPRDYGNAELLGAILEVLLDVRALLLSVVMDGTR